MSASMRSTRAPVWDRAIAVLMAVVVFPSAGFGLETISVLGGFPEEESRMDVRILRYASESMDLGWPWVISSTGEEVPKGNCRRRAWEISGTVPKEGRWI